MKYEKEINEILNVVIPKEKWMSEEDHQEVIEETFKHLGINRQTISDNIEVGVANGFTVNHQIGLLKDMFLNICQ